ncbi:MAG: hypothetical protein H8K09_15000 [Nitrospira sp.]|nr:hypothetical protein [Nitrospira sp.]
MFIGKLVGLLLAVLFLFSLQSCSLIGTSTNLNSDLDNLLAEYGFTAIRPPSLLTPPGTVVHVRHSSPYEVGIVCSTIGAVGESTKWHESDSNSSTLAQKASGTFDVTANYLSLIKGEAKYQSVKNIKATLRNVKVLAIYDEDIVAGLKKQSDNCKTAMKAKLDSKTPMTMVESALQADVVYSVDFEDSVSLTGEEKNAILQGLSLALSAKADTTTNYSLLGTGLYWGLVDDPSKINFFKPAELALGISGTVQVVAKGQGATMRAPKAPRLIGPTTRMGKEAIVVSDQQ